MTYTGLTNSAPPAKLRMHRILLAGDNRYNPTGAGEFDESHCPGIRGLVLHHGIDRGVLK